jgi:hypothetical protein
MNRKTLSLVALGLLALLVVAGCAAPAKPLSVSISENQCTVDGPKAIAKGPFSVKLAINQQKPTESGFGIFALEEGKTIEDFNAWPKGTGRPPFTMELAFQSEFENGDFNYNLDTGALTGNSLYKGQPVYVVCLRADPDAGALAPIADPFGPVAIK